MRFSRCQTSQIRLPLKRFPGTADLIKLRILGCVQETPAAPVATRVQRTLWLSGSSVRRFASAEPQKLAHHTGKGFLQVFHPPHQQRMVSTCSTGPRDGEGGEQPSAILVTSGDWVLLTRQQNWPGGHFSLLSGPTAQQGDAKESVPATVQRLAGIAVDPGSISAVSPDDSEGQACFQAQALQDSSEARARGLDLLQGKARSCARDVRVEPHEVEAVLGHVPPEPQRRAGDAGSCRWFKMQWLAASLSGKLKASSFTLSDKFEAAKQVLHAYLHKRKPDSAVDEVMDVIIEAGVFKYVLLVVTDQGKGQSKLVVRGDRKSGYHMDVFEKTMRELLPQGLHVAEPLGGGRISHDADAQKINIYGYSSAYGQAPHDLSAAIVRQWYPLYPSENITVSYEGY